VCVCVVWCVRVCGVRVWCVCVGVDSPLAVRHFALQFFAITTRTY
jgi:hypothetical protein